jgi:hypothetical protein
VEGAPGRCPTRFQPPSRTVCMCWPLPQLRFKCQHLQWPGVIGPTDGCSAMLHGMFVLDEQVASSQGLCTGALVQAGVLGVLGGT